MDPYSIRTRVFFDFYVTLWGMILPNKLILVKIRLEKVDWVRFTFKKSRKTSKNALALTL